MASLISFAEGHRMYDAGKPLIGWWALGAPIMPGRLTFGGGYLDLRHVHIEAWMQNPNGLWQAEVEVTPSGTLHYRLSFFHPSSTR